jgi:hypothetical protein
VLFDYGRLGGAFRLGRTISDFGGNKSEKCGTKRCRAAARQAARRSGELFKKKAAT